MRRSLALLLAASAALTATAGFALSRSAPSASREPVVMASIAVKAPKSGPTSSVADFPNCPAPAVNGMNIRATKAGKDTALTIFVVVQNVGTRAFFADGGVATLAVAIGDKRIGAFEVKKLSASEVKFFTVQARADAGAKLEDITASLTFKGDARIGRVADTLDCQTTDNQVVRKGQSIEASLARSAG